MRKSSKFRLLLLFIAGIIFIVFVLVMQRQFNNPDFDFQNEASEVNELENDEETEKADAADEDADTDEESGDSESEEESEETDADTGDSNEEEYEVTAEVLNIRSSPNADSEVVETLVNGDIVQLIGEEDEYEWVEISYQDVTGYANAGYLEAVE
ncbi:MULTISPECIES: SH3 domain-containing protein [Oceanobacillus]|uniref:SH3 domain-containing protein n=1 Tax=Oceanobacillus aidingensis TaxID=645964 RepID=A0ABV9JZV9_9BACI|nr:SH3 domain-containing protein [Oceanobacillus oncorhynchi]MDM8098593.1 SH3 domain-containing protein [Oceanobacillus oncorhynchi]